MLYWVKDNQDSQTPLQLIVKLRSHCCVKTSKLACKIVFADTVTIIYMHPKYLKNNYIILQLSLGIQIGRLLHFL